MNNLTAVQLFLLSLDISMYYYYAFGLTIASEFEFPELFVVGDNPEPDVFITFGSTPDSLDENNLLRPDLWLTDSQYLLKVDGIANYYAEKGTTIIVEKITSTDEKSMRLYLLSSTMAAIIQQRNLIPLHASGILTDKGVILLLGDCGAGKSTTLKALNKKGYRIFTDDVCVIRYETGKVFAIPSYPLIKLWDKSFNLLQIELKKENEKLWPDLEKYGIAFHDQFIRSWKPISTIFIIEKSCTEEAVFIKKEKGIESFISIGENTYGNNFVELMKKRELHFNMVNHLIKNSEIYKITRPENRNSIEEVVEQIENTILQRS